MDINPLFTLFSQWSALVKKKQPYTQVYLSITSVGTGHVSIISGGESITPFSWNSEREGLHKLRTEITIAKISQNTV